MNESEQLLQQFVVESNNLLREMQALLGQGEQSSKNSKSLEEYGQRIDRIMGGAQSLAMIFESETILINNLKTLGQLAALGKSLGYLLSQITDQEKLYKIGVSFLLDSQEILEEIFTKMPNPQTWKTQSVKIPEHLLGRLKWLKSQFQSEMRESVSIHSVNVPQIAGTNQPDWDQLLKLLGEQ